MMNVKSITSNWNLIKILRIAIGFFILVDGYQSHEWVISLLGIGFIAMGLLNMGCGFSGSCNVNQACDNQMKVSEKDKLNKM
jgi:hypothetical protein